MDMLHDNIKCSFTTIPFKSSLSFEYLIAKIEKIAKEPSHVLYDSAKKNMEDLKKIPKLRGTIEDFNLVRENRKLVNRMMGFVFNPFKDDIEISAACAPFYPKPFYSTGLYDRLMRGDHNKLEMDKYINKDNILLGVIYQAYLIILMQFYSQEFNFDIPFQYRLTNEKNNTVKYLKMLVDPSYTEVKVKGKLNKLSNEEIKELLNNASDLDFWNEKIPLHKFEFTGFLQFSYIDVTHESVISQLKSDLLDKHTIISQSGFTRIRQKIRSLMEIPDLEFGMAAFGDFERTLDQNVIWRTIIPQSELACDEYNGTLYETAYRQQKMVFTNDFKKLEKSKISSLFLKREIRNHVIIPLSLEDEIVGMMEFGAKNPDQINLVQVKRLNELFPMFSIALRRSKEELNDRIRAIIQEECTAIHPTVEWRFRQAASNMLVDDLKGDGKKMEQIIFSDIIPVYGATDIRNSSVERNQAIQSDLTEHLKLAKELLIKGMVNKDMPLLDHLIYKTDKQLVIVNSELKAGDEVSILEFLRKEIEPVFLQLKDRDSLLNHYKKLIMLRHANPEIARGEYTALQFDGYYTFGGFLSTYQNSTVGIFHNVGESEITIDLSLYTSHDFSTVRGYAGEGNATLSGQTLTISPHTSVVLK